MADRYPRQSQISEQPVIPGVNTHIDYVPPSRPVPSVPEPARHHPTDDEFYMPGEPRRPNVDFLRDHFFREGRLTEDQALFILSEATRILSMEPNLVNVTSPVTICGDIHGQYYDLMKLFEVGGAVGPQTGNTYLFLGDYVDRGCFGIECLLYLYALKICYGGYITLLRGNHECRHLTEYFTFRRECLHKYSPTVYEHCIQSFCSLPIAAVVDDRFFCVHGGLSPELITLSDLKTVNRFQEPGSQGLLCDLLWSDPIANFGHEQDRSTGGPVVAPGSMFLHNGTRGCSYFFTYDAACTFLERNKLLGIIRGHEAQDAGYTMHRKTPTKKFPSVITIFSAPNYLDVYRNRGAVLKYANKNITIRQYNSSPHPYWLPNFMDAFTWSLPFVGAKITEMLLAILSICSQEELIDTDSDSDEENNKLLAEAAMSPAELQQRRQQIKSKIMAVGRMQRVFELLRQEAESASELSTDANALSAPREDALGVQGMQIKRNIHSFADARRSDLLNERLPEFDPTAMFPVPSMRVGSRRGSGDSEGMNMEYLIKKTLEEEEENGSTVELLADRIARGRKATGRPTALKRHETA